MSAGKLTIAVCQPGVIPESHDEALAMVSHVLSDAEGCDLVVLPELALCGYGNPERIRRLATPADGQFVASLCDAARNAGIGLVAGLAEKDDEVLYNAAIAINADGTFAGIYRKVNLWGAYENGLFAVGAPPPVIDMRGFRIGLLICHDVDYPETARDLALRGADLLVVLSATNKRYHLVADMVVPTRAYENVLFVAYADAAGIDGAFRFLGRSRIVAPDTGIRAALPDASPGLARATIRREDLEEFRQAHPYLRNRKTDVYF
jgi:predicted amidohydrolase